jgi:hypothetical protein
LRMNTAYRLDWSGAPLLRQTIHSAGEIGCAARIDETSIGGGSLTWVETLSTILPSAAGSGGFGESGATASEKEQPARAKHANTMNQRITHFQMNMFAQFRKRRKTLD